MVTIYVDIAIAIVAMYLGFCAGAAWAREWTYQRALEWQGSVLRSAANSQNSARREARTVVDFVSTEESNYTTLLPWVDRQPLWAWRDDLIAWLMSKVTMFGFRIHVWKIVLSSAIITVIGSAPWVCGQ